MAFERIDTEIDGLVLVQPKVISDDRGFFFETYRRNEYAALGIDVEFVQDNHSRSVRGTIRALHFQLQPGQAKLIRCARGSVYDVAVDLRKDSPTYGQHEAFELSDENAQQVFIPVGFAHGFCVTSEEADVTYKVSSYYDGADRARHRLGRPRDRRAVAGGRAARLRSRPRQPAARGDRRRAPLVSASASRSHAGGGMRSTGGTSTRCWPTSTRTSSGAPRRARAGWRATSTGARRAYERWLREELPEVWEDFRGEDLEFRELPGGPGAAARVRPQPGPRRAAPRCRVPFGQLARFRDGRVVASIHGFPDHASAREAAGLRRASRPSRRTAVSSAYAMLRQYARSASTDLTLGEAAREIGVSVDTLRRWDRDGKVRTVRDERNRRRVPRREVERLSRRPRRHAAGDALSARNRFPGRVVSVEVGRGDGAGRDRGRAASRDRGDHA